MTTYHLDADTTFPAAICGANNPQALTCNADRVNCAECKRLLAMIECGHCGAPKPADRSCDCFDNHCQ